MAPDSLDPRLLPLLVCPRSKSPLEVHAGGLVSPEGRTYRIIEGIPVLLLDDVETTGSGAAEDTIAKIRGDAPLMEFPVPAPTGAGAEPIEPLVQQFISAAGGNLYRRVINKLDRYPIPDFPLTCGAGRLLIDLGCHWGRWTLAATRQGWLAIGLDPSLEAVRAARRVAAQLKLDALFVVGDARFMPFPAETADCVFSFSVLQHFSRADVSVTLGEVARVLRTGGVSLVQMPNRWSALGLYHLSRRRFRDGSGFEVRYWSRGDLERAFGTIGRTDVLVDSFFAINVQPPDAPLLPLRERTVIRASEWCVRASRRIPPLRRVADSYYVRSEKGA